MTNFNFTGILAIGSSDYCTLQQYKDYQRITSTDVIDDGFISLDITGASRWIDRESNTNFYGITKTNKYDTPFTGRNFLPFSSMQLNSVAVINLDEWLISITTLTNGDGSVLTTSDYYVLPANDTPIMGIGLFPSVNKSWLAKSTGELIQAISVLGVWGYALTAPTDIIIAVLEITKALYSRRFGENMATKTVITSAGVVQIPEGVPDMAAQTIAKYRRLAIG